ncbi:aldo/keto reductase [Allostreptomyces psammosilenae]|uniref:Aryl-alcohol dehydrogenase-like predicted oxidoreductase n=1 Tax=Allostreptomyces psammosilenae TaxID=1892865 RepID=A0A852ZUF0_9ACTN|nr:aldo/keto reductase [Allostreptomyces psammosilenae]NYI05525.1 aryl-alcohol dehydrogenase-like predicted oxidoreductase [Allostreptomyces psammosilenae]
MTNTAVNTHTTANTTTGTTDAAATPDTATGDRLLIGGDLPVRRIGFGAMRLADGPGAPTGAQAPVWTAPADRAAAVALLRRAVEAGVDLIDTADAYALGANEELVAEALSPYRDGVVVATKVGVVRSGPTEWVPLGHPAYLRQQAELSLRRLRVDRIDLLHLHRIDPAYPLEDQIGALRQLQEEGKVRHIGLSEVTVEQIREASRIAPIASVQNLYNLATRDHEEVVDHTAERGIAFLPFFPIAMGAHAAPDGPLAAVARELGATPAQTALAWLLRRSPTMLPIPGTTSAAHLVENVAAARLALTEEQFARIAAVSS